MMRPAVELQQKGDCYYFIADYHALTSLQDPKELTSRVREVATDFLACGLDPEKTVFFVQSAVPEVHELAWFLSNLCPLGLLERCHSFKDKTARGIKPNHGLFAYPVLMTADILLYDAELVPVGRDQKQHLEVARDLAGKFNEAYGEVFRVPEADIRDETAVLPGTDGQKMSKSYGNTIEIFAPEKPFRKRFMSLKTDSTPVEDPKPVEDSVILALAKCVMDDGEVAAMEESFRAGGTGYGHYKKQLADAAWSYFEGFRAKRAELESDPGIVDEVLKQGAIRARETASAVLDRARRAVGVRA
jgi:tryptophanyl-tRNA synthetase